MTLEEQIKEMAAKLLDLIPGDNSVHLMARRSGHHEVGIHIFESYQAGTEYLRSLGIGKREKKVYSDETSYCVAIGYLDGLEITCYCSGLPPSCRVVEKIQRVPKTEVKETQDFVEIRKLVVECGPERDSEKVEVVA